MINKRTASVISRMLLGAMLLTPLVVPFSVYAAPGSVGGSVGDSNRGVTVGALMSRDSKTRRTIVEERLDYVIRTVLLPKIDVHGNVKSPKRMQYDKTRAGCANLLFNPGPNAAYKTGMDDFFHDAAVLNGAGPEGRALNIDKLIGSFIVRGCRVGAVTPTKPKPIQL